MMNPISRAWPLVKISNLSLYVLAAVIARMATGGSAIAIILLATNQGASPTQAGVFAACMTAPHIFGPIYGRWLDKSISPQRLIAYCCFVFVGAFQLAILGFNSQNSWLCISALLLCGTCSSFLMGGLSTQLNSLVKNKQARRRAQSYDTFTYSVGLTLGPMMVALLADAYSTNFAAAMLMSLPLAAGLIIINFPAKQTAAQNPKNKVMGFMQVFKNIKQSPHLARTLAMTSGASFSVAALPILAVYLASTWQKSAQDGAYLSTAYGVGCLCGSALIMIKPLKANAIALLRNLGILLLGSLLLILMSASFATGLAAYWFCGVINSLFFAATLAARSEYAPENGAAQIYMWVAAAKIAAASLGAFVTGVMIAYSNSSALIASMGVLLVSLIGCFWRWHYSQEQP